MFVEQTKEIMYWKWHTALTGHLSWTCLHHVLFLISLVVFVDICANFINWILYNWTEMTVSKQ